MRAEDGFHVLAPRSLNSDEELEFFFFFFLILFITVDVRASLGFELMTIGEQTQDRTN